MRCRLTVLSAALIATLGCQQDPEPDTEPEPAPPAKKPKPPPPPDAAVPADARTYSEPCIDPWSEEGKRVRASAKAALEASEASFETALAKKRLTLWVSEDADLMGQIDREGPTGDGQFWAGQREFGRTRSGRYVAIDRAPRVVITERHTMCGCKPFKPGSPVPARQTFYRVPFDATKVRRRRIVYRTEQVVIRWSEGPCSRKNPK